MPSGDVFAITTWDKLFYNPSSTPLSFWENWWAVNKFNYILSREPIKWVELTATGEMVPCNNTELRKEIFDFLISALKNTKNPMTRATAVLTIGKLKDKAALPALKKIFASDDNFGVRNIVAWSLAMLGDSTALDDIKTIDEENNIKSFKTITGTYGAFALGALKNDSAREALVDILFYHINPEDMEAKYTALTALGNTRDKSLVPFISSLLNDDFFNEKLRICAALALGRLQDASALPELRKGLEIKKPDIRAAVAIAMGMYKSTEVLPDLISIMEKDGSAQVKSYAAIALASINDKSVYRVISKGAGSLDYTMRNMCTLALGLVGNEKSSREIENVIAKGPQEVNYNAAIIASGLAKNKASSKDLLNVINTTQNASTWLYAVEALGLMDAKEVSPTLQLILKAAMKNQDIDDNLFNGLVISLARLGKKEEVLAELFKQMEVEELPPKAPPEVNKRKPQNNTLPPAVKKNDLQNKELLTEIKKRNLRAIGYIGDITSIKPLMKLYNKETDDKVRLQALFALSLILDSDKITPFYREEFLLLEINKKQPVK